MPTRKCVVCNQPLVGRVDRKYCSDICRFQANNEAKIANDKIVRDTNSLLRKNRSILKTLCPEGRATVRREILENLGFSFALFTSLYVTKNRQVYYFSYNYGFSAIVDKGIQKVLIISRQPYMDKWDPWKYVKTDNPPAGDNRSPI